MENAKRLFLTVILLIVAVTLTSTSAVAGSRQQHRWEGVAIGIGAAILGHAIYPFHKGSEPASVVYALPEDSGRVHRRSEHPRGHWEWQRTWVPPVYERAWNPGHYNPNGRWVAGQWIEVKRSDGHWTKERIWIAEGDGRHPR